MFNKKDKNKSSRMKIRTLPSWENAVITDLSTPPQTEIFLFK